jgi:hypothetical protein
VVLGALLVMEGLLVVLLVVLVFAVGLVGWFLGVSELLMGLWATWG